MLFFKSRWYRSVTAGHWNCSRQLFVEKAATYCVPSEATSRFVKYGIDTLHEDRPERWSPYIQPALTQRDSYFLATQFICAFHAIPRINSDYLRKENQGGLCNRQSCFLWGRDCICLYDLYELLPSQESNSHFPSFPCKLNTFRKRVKNVVTSKGLQVGFECK